MQQMTSIDKAIPTFENPSGHLLQHNQGAAGPQGLRKCLGSVGADVIALQTVTNCTSHVTFIKAEEPNSPNKSKYIQTASYSLQLSQRAVGLQGLCKGLGSDTADFVVRQAVQKQQPKKKHPRMNDQ